MVKFLFYSDSDVPNRFQSYNVDFRSHVCIDGPKTRPKLTWDERSCFKSQERDGTFRWVQGWFFFFFLSSKEG